MSAPAAAGILFGGKAMSRYSHASYGEADEVADALDDETDPMILRAALINALRKIARLERRLEATHALVTNPQNRERPENA